MTKISFNLIDMPWIPVVDHHGAQRKVGLLTLFEDAPHIKAILPVVPVVNSALYRHLLLPMLMRIFSLRDDLDWRQLWERGSFDMTAIRAYLESSKIYHRFELFDPTQPFYQAADSRVQPKSLLKLVPHFASGNNATLFDHSTEARGKVLSPDTAALYLIALQAYGLGGLSGIPEKFTAAPACRGISFYVLGNNLFETLMLNLLPAAGDPRTYNVISRDPRYEDLPAWEMDDPFEPRDTPRGLIDYLTWQNRRVLLFPETQEGEIVVRTMTEAPGLRLKEGFIDGVAVRDPYQYFHKGSTAPLVVRFSEDRAVWRDSASLFQFEGENGLTPPPILLWMRMLVNNDFLKRSATYHLTALGMAADKAKVLFYGEENLPLPSEYFADPELVHSLRGALEDASHLHSALYRASAVMAEYMIDPDMDIENTKPDRKMVDALRKHLDPTRVFWSGLESGFYQLMTTLPLDETAALESWNDLLRRQAWHAFEHSLTLLGEDIRALKATARAGAVIAGVLHTHPNGKGTDDASNDLGTDTIE